MISKGIDATALWYLSSRPSPMGRDLDIFSSVLSTGSPECPEIKAVGCCWSCGSCAAVTSYHDPRPWSNQWLLVFLRWCGNTVLPQSGQIQGRQQLTSPPLDKPGHFLCHPWTFGVLINRSSNFLKNFPETTINFWPFIPKVDKWRPPQRRRWPRSGM